MLSRRKLGTISKNWISAFAGMTILVERAMYKQILNQLTERHNIFEEIIVEEIVKIVEYDP